MVPVVRGPRRLKPTPRIDPREIDRVARLVGQLFEILQLGAAVAFAERVDVVHVAHDGSGRPREDRAAQASQEIRLLKAPVNVGHAGFDELAKLELVAALGDLDGAQLARPGVQVLKKMPVNGAKVSEVKVPRGRAFSDPLGDKPPLHLVQLIGIGEPEPVSQNGRTRIEVGVVAAHSAASGTALARI